jgi:hypothetical protein
MFSGHDRWTLARRLVFVQLLNDNPPFADPMKSAITVHGIHGAERILLAVKGQRIVSVMDAVPTYVTLARKIH